ncbi:MAG: hypothetical protein AB7P04_08900 [Bacteriovoracia bacterium]
MKSALYLSLAALLAVNSVMAEENEFMPDLGVDETPETPAPSPTAAPAGAPAAPTQETVEVKFIRPLDGDRFLFELIEDLEIHAGEKATLKDGPEWVAEIRVMKISQEDFTMEVQVLKELEHYEPFVPEDLFTAYFSATVSAPTAPPASPTPSVKKTPKRPPPPRVLRTKRSIPVADPELMRDPRERPERAERGSRLFANSSNRTRNRWGADLTVLDPVAALAGLRINYTPFDFMRVGAGYGMMPTGAVTVHSFSAGFQFLVPSFSVSPFLEADFNYSIASFSGAVNATDTNAVLFGLGAATRSANASYFTFPFGVDWQAAGGFHLQAGLLISSFNTLGTQTDTRFFGRLGWYWGGGTRGRRGMFDF